ncbi:MAG TPA: hypothetical protein EYP64_00230 [Desulfarculaceae bacterium]|nr:hypothetical protein [Desulfarculaceae bacterium]
MNYKAQRQLTGLALSLIIASLLLLAGCNIPFLPRQEIDSFPMDNELIETMEVEGILYTLVVNPQAAGNPDAPAAIWVPSSAYQRGSYEVYTEFLPEPEEHLEVASAEPAIDDTLAPAAPGEISQDELAAAVLSREEELKDNLKVNLMLRRRALLFPSRISIIRPEIVTLLSLELEDKLPLRVNETRDPQLLQQGRLLLNRSEITKRAQKWLQNQESPTPFQFIIFLDSSPGRNFQFYTCTWIDAQTGNRVATFTFRANLEGRLLRPLVPENPVPLQNLINSTSWWCKIRSRQEADNYLLEAGHRSDLDYGRKLTVFRKAVPIKDPRSHDRLGFLFREALGVVNVVDFFAADSSLAQAQTPLSTTFKSAWAVAMPAEESEKSPAAAVIPAE